MKNVVFWDVMPCVALVRTDVSENNITSIMRERTIGELGTLSAPLTLFLAR
jgi:hypothetical protein